MMSNEAETPVSVEEIATDYLDTIVQAITVSSPLDQLVAFKAAFSYMGLMAYVLRDRNTKKVVLKGEHSKEAQAFTEDLGERLLTIKPISEATIANNPQLRTQFIQVIVACLNDHSLKKEN